jgi:hypothetical protein
MMVKTGHPADRGHESSPSADEEVARLRLQLNDFSCEELEEKGLLTHDQEEMVVRKGPRFEEDRPPMPRE